MKLGRYSDELYEYRHVQLPKNMLKAIPKEYHDPSKGTLKLLWEEEWRALGITQVRTRYIIVTRLEANSHVRVLDGNIMKCMSQNPIYCSSSKWNALKFVSNNC